MHHVIKHPKLSRSLSQHHNKPIDVYMYVQLILLHFPRGAKEVFLGFFLSIHVLRQIQ